MKRKHTKSFTGALAALFLLAGAGIAHAQPHAPGAPQLGPPQGPGGPPPGGPQRPGGPPGAPHDPLQGALFPPELIMGHQSEINLSADQKKKIIAEISATQSALVEKQFAVQEESEKLAKLIRADSVDEKAALAQAERVMNLERDVKKTHLRLLIRIKNTLTAEQRTQLRKLQPGR